MVEQLTLNQLVLGSSPSRGTNWVEESNPARRNGLRHPFVTFHMAMHANENLTAAEAGNSPHMIHDYYRALATRREAMKWLAVKPAKAADVLPLPAATRKDAH